MRQPAAVLLDCGSTLIHIDVAALSERLEVPAQQLRAAFQAALAIETAEELAHAWCLLAGCPERMSAVFAEALAAPGFYRDVAFDTRRALEDLRSRGVRLGVVANGEGQLDEELRATGLRELVDLSVDSQLFGSPKPHRSIFESACAQLSVSMADCWFVGDSLVNDYIGSSRAGFGRSVLFDREDLWAALPVPRVTSLSQLVNMIDAC